MKIFFTAIRQEEFSVKEPFLNIIKWSLSLGHVPRPIKLVFIKSLSKKPQ